jgi:hypothetical protein
MRLFIVPVLAAAAAASCVDASLVGVGNFGPFSQQSLYAIDPATGAATLIGNTGLVNINDVAWDAASGRLLAYTTAADLYELNFSTGAATLLAARAGTVPEGSLTVDAGGGLFTTNADVLCTLNRATGALAPIGVLGLNDNDISGIAFVGGRLFGYAKNGTAADTLVEINPATGQGVSIGALATLSGASVGGLAFDGSTLFLTDSANLFSVDPLTATATLIGAHGVGGFSGLAFIPAPSTAGLLAFAGLAAARRRR